MDSRSEKFPSGTRVIVLVTDAWLKANDVRGNSKAFYRQYEGRGTIVGRTSEWDLDDEPTYEVAFDSPREICDTPPGPPVQVLKSANLPEGWLIRSRYLIREIP